MRLRAAPASRGRNRCGRRATPCRARREPPPAAEDLHEELVAALTEARDATAEVAYAVEIDEAEGVEPLLPEWRGSLFRVRLARLRAIERTNALAAEARVATARKRRAEAQGSSWSAIVATILILGGAFLFTESRAIPLD